MPLTRVDLSITLATNSTCTGMTLVDSTPDYGGVGKITINSVNRVTIKTTINSGIYLLYTFTVLNGTITAATLSISGATATNILASLTSTVWPFVATPFNIWGSYGVTLPTFADGVIAVEYTVAGLDPNDGTTPFSYTTSKDQLVVCDAFCCVAKMYQAIDPDCECSDEALEKADKAWGYLQIALFSTNVGNTDRAQLALEKAQALCDCGCSDC